MQFQGAGGTFQLNGVAGIASPTVLNVANNGTNATGTVAIGHLNENGRHLERQLVDSPDWSAPQHWGRSTRHGDDCRRLGDIDGSDLGHLRHSGGTSTADNLTTGTLNVNGGEFQVNGTITDGDADGSASGSSVVTINLNGGTLRFNTLSRSTATNTFAVNFNSGTIRTNTGVNQVVTNVPISLLTAGVHNFETYLDVQRRFNCTRPSAARVV